jgi:hypothetical protein
MDPTTTPPAPASPGLIERSLAAAVHQCERHALTCTLVVTADGERACLDYLGGSLARVEINGFFLDDPSDALGEVTRWRGARCRVATAPPELGPDDEPTQPMRKVAAPGRGRARALLIVAGVAAVAAAVLAVVA